MQTIEKKIKSWYQLNKRDFPWRHTKNPYYIWVCEIMSQQTQMARVQDYYQRFLTIFPTLEDLAYAKEEDLLKAWEGLGYYSRVRNMQTAALQVLELFSGVFPNNYQDLLKLKGIGTYTAAAIASICFDEPVAAVDGNVLRVVTRLKEIDDDILAQKTKNKIKILLEEEITESNTGDFNQAFIELGAMVCTPQNPKCLLCPLIEDCAAYEHKTTDKYPVKKKKIKQVEEYYYTFIVQNADNAILLHKETKKSLLHGMFALPQYENQDNFSEVLQQLKHDTGIDFVQEQVIYKGAYKHVFSHKVWLMETYIISVTNQTENFHQIESVPLPNAHRNIL